MHFSGDRFIFIVHSGNFADSDFTNKLFALSHHTGKYVESACSTSCGGDNVLLLKKITAAIRRLQYLKTEDARDAAR